MPSSNITGLTALAVMQPTMLLYAGISPFGATDDRKITAGELLTTITPLDNNTAALVVTNSAIPTVPQVVFTNAAGTKRMQIAMAGAATITDTFDELSMFSSVAGLNLSIGVWNAIDDGSAAEIFLYTGAAGLEHTRLRAVDNGNTNTDLFTVPKSGVLLTSNTSSGGLILDTDVAAPIIFATGGHAFTNEKGRFDAAGFTLGKASSVTGALNLANSASANLTTIQAGNAAAARTYVWPTDFGAAGDVLTDAAGDGVLSWAAGGGGGGSFSGARVENSATQSLSNVGNPALTFDTEVYDTDGYYSGGSPTRFTIPATGKYLLTGSFFFDSGGGSYRLGFFHLNNATIIASSMFPPVGGNQSSPCVSTVASLTAGDFVEFKIAQDTGGALNTAITIGLPNFTITRLDGSGTTPSTAPQVRVTNNANQSIADNTAALLNFNTERFDTDAMHFTSSANLTGTVAKDGTTAVVGTGTAFLSELSVGQVIMIPGTANERRVVTLITDDTHLTVNTAFVNTASGQVGVRQNGCLVARTAGLYQITLSIRWGASGVGIRSSSIVLNANTPSDGTFVAFSNTASAGGTDPLIVSTTTLTQLAQWDFVSVNVFQTSGGALNVDSSAAYSPDFMMVRISGF